MTSSPLLRKIPHFVNVYILTEVLQEFREVREYEAAGPPMESSIFFIIFILT
jgi:hypothetical protein